MLHTRFTTRLSNAGYSRLYRHHEIFPRLFGTQSRRLSQEQQEQSSYRSGVRLTLSGIG